MAYIRYDEYLYYRSSLYSDLDSVLFLDESLLLVRRWNSLSYNLLLRRNIELFLSEVIYERLIYLLCLRSSSKNVFVFLSVLYMGDKIQLDFLVYLESLLCMSYFLKFNELYLLKENLLFDGSKSFFFYIFIIFYFKKYD